MKGIDVPVELCRLPLRVTDHWVPGSSPASENVTAYLEFPDPAAPVKTAAESGASTAEAVTESESWLGSA